MGPCKITRIIDGKRYSTETATMLASDCWWDGSNHERGGRNTFLYRTPKGAYFALHRSMWQGEHDTIEPLTQAEALKLYERMADHDCDEVSVSVAFPDYPIEDA